MNRIEIEVVLQAAFSRCEVAGYPLNERQKRILFEVAQLLAQDLTNGLNLADPLEINPLDLLTSEQRQAFLQYVAECNQSNDAWKARLLNDWLHNRNSGPVQFIRDQYGVQWLDQFKPPHLTAYADTGALSVKVGDRLEVSNALWEWIPETNAANSEWFPCTVIRVFELADNERSFVNCTVRLENGLEYDINGMYDWNRYNWRWPAA
jgi:hypothetical protein